MYNPDAENVNNQAPQFYEPTSTQYIQPYREYPAYPASRSNQQYQPQQPYQSRSWSAENNYAVQGEKLTVRPQAQSPRYRGGSVGKVGKAAKISKAQALAIVKTCKKWLVVGSVLFFGVISGLVITHATGVTSQTATNSGSQQAAPSTSGQGGFFQQPQGGNGIGNNGTSQNPVSSTRVS